MRSLEPHLKRAAKSIWAVHPNNPEREADASEHEPVVSDLLFDLKMLFGCASEAMEAACIGVETREEALGQMTEASLEAILREIDRYSDAYIRELDAIDHAHERAESALEEYYRLSEHPDSAASLLQVQEQLEDTRNRMRRELAVAIITDSSWWREVAR